MSDKKNGHLYCEKHGWVSTTKAPGKTCSKPLGNGKYCSNRLRETEERKVARNRQGGRRHLDGTPARGQPADKAVTYGITMTASMLEEASLFAEKKGISFNELVRQSLKEKISNEI